MRQIAIDQQDGTHLGFTPRRQLALSRWEDEGGADLRELLPGVPDMSNAELVQLRIRVIALENIVIALLAKATQSERDLARDMAAYIAPREGTTPHPLTLKAATQMMHLVDRSMHFRAPSSS